MCNCYTYLQTNQNGSSSAPKSVTAITLPTPPSSAANRMSNLQNTLQIAPPEPPVSRLILVTGQTFFNFDSSW